MTAHLLKVWDRPVRLLHWSLVSLVAATWWTGGTSGPLHERLGYAVLAVVLARLLWGFTGSRYARFAQFVRSPSVTLGYLRQVLRAQAPRHIGHNPLGGWMVLALLVCAGALGVTGVLYTTDWLWGYAWLEQLHAGLAWALLALVALHVSGVVFTSLAHRENLVKAMVHGGKRPPAPGDVD